MEGFFDRELSPISPYFVPSFVVLLFKGEGEISMQNARKVHLARVRRCIEQFCCAATEKRKMASPKSVGAAVNYTCSGSLPLPCGQKREITRRWLFSPVSDEAILLAVRVVAFRIDFSAILLRVVHSPA